MIEAELSNSNTIVVHGKPEDGITNYTRDLITLFEPTSIIILADNFKPISNLDAELKRTVTTGGRVLILANDPMTEYLEKSRHMRAYQIDIAQAKRMLNKQKG